MPWAVRWPTEIISQGRIIEAHQATAWRWVQTAVTRAEELDAIGAGKRIGTHTLRHSCAWHLLMKGIPINYLVCCQRASDVSVWTQQHPDDSHLPGTGDRPDGECC